MTNNVIIAEGEVHGIGHPDFPGGCGVSRSIWKREYDNSIYWNRVEKAVRRYKKIRRMGVAEYGITLAPLQDNSYK